MRVAILGAGDISKIHRFSGISESQVQDLIEELGKFLAEKQYEIIIVPDRGIPYEVAKIYKKHKGPKVIGQIPQDDKDYGLKHIEEYRHISDEEENIGDWYDLNGKIAAKGDIAICLGLSGGAICDVAMLKYHYKYLNNKTKLFIFENTISSRLQPELEEDLKNNLTYVRSVDELKMKLEGLDKLENQ